ncbi:hypothetical protein [Cellulomonas terrae]|nr:hypothetical protein [Cellulomonas terrae]
MEMWWVIPGAVFVGLLVPLWHVVRQDGLGHRLPPPSHATWSDRTESLT